MLLQNITLHSQYPVRRFGATSVASESAALRTTLGVRGTSQLAPFVGGLDPASSFPTGWRFGNGWMPPKSGTATWVANLGAAAAEAAGAVAAVLYGGKNAEASLAGSGDLAAEMGLIASMAASISGGGDVTEADLRAYLQLVASLSGSGELAGAIGALADAEASIGGSGGATATATALGTLIAQIVVTGTGLNTGNVAAAVWGAAAAAYNDSGTMGAKLNSAASGGVDYNALADAVWSHADADRIVLIEKILRNKSITDATTGEFVLFDDDGTTELFRVPLWEDAAGTQPYRGEGAERKERLE